MLIIFFEIFGSKLNFFMNYILTLVFMAVNFSSLMDSKNLYIFVVGTLN